MSEEDKSTAPSKLPVGPNSPKPESPTTARPLEFDDEPQETGTTTAVSGAANTAQTETETPPPKPPRPVSPRQQAETTLKEAFPTLEGSVVKAVLVASGWNVERAFHALLGMTDPNSQTEDVPPAKPPRPTASQRQVEADEMYARQLAEHYNRRAAPRRFDDDDARYRQGRESDDEREYSFFDDDLPVIRDNIRKGFEDTQTKVNSWVQNFKKRWDGDEMEEEQPGRSYSQGYRQGYGEDQIYSGARRSGDLGRRSGDRERYDADPQLLDDNFAALELRDSEAPPPRPPRPLANPNLSKSSTPSSVRRKVSFQEGPPTEIGTSAAASETTNPAPAPSTGSKQSKWQPLSSVEQSPVGEHDPFSLGDSDDEKDTTKPKDRNPTAESEPLQTVTAEAIPEDDVDSASKANTGKTEETGKS